MLDAGADPNARDEYGWTPLHRAAAWSNEDPAVVKALVDAGADIEVRDEDDKTPLHYALDSNKGPDAAALLRNAYTDPD